VILTPQQSAKSLAAIEVEFVSGKAAETRMSNAELETLRCGVPAARGLVLLEALAKGKPAQINIAYLDDNHLSIRVTPC